MKQPIKYALIILTIIQIGCGWISRRKEIIGVSSKQALVFISKSDTPSGYQITVKSDIDGEINILDGQNNILHIPKGSHTLTVRNDQYSDTLKLEYIPQGVTKGKVIIDYNF